MNYECDEVSDCLDNSDEISCEILKIDHKSYRKEYPPIKENDQRITVKVSMIITAISNIHDIKETFQAKFTIKLEWCDDRLTFHYLKNSTMSNLIGNEERNEIWIPPLIFNNTDSNQIIANNPFSGMFVHKRGKGKLLDLSEVSEGDTYNGSENPLMYTADYALTHHCIFVLNYYPFDTQKCEIQVSTRKSIIK